MAYIINLLGTIAIYITEALEKELYIAGLQEMSKIGERLRDTTFQL